MLILDVLWLLICVVFLVFFIHQWRLSRHIAKWPSTTGHIIKLTWHQDKERLWPEIEYMYSLNGYEYIGHDLFKDTRLNTINSKRARELAYKVAVAHKNHQEIDVYYNPDYPEDSALEVGIPKKIYVIMILLSGFLLFHLYRLAF